MAYIDDEESFYEVERSPAPAMEGSEIAIWSDQTKRIMYQEDCNLPCLTDEEKLDFEFHIRDKRISSRIQKSFVKKINIETP